MAGRFMTDEEIAAHRAKKERARQAPEVVAAREAIAALRKRAQDAAAELRREAHLIADHLVEEGHDSDVIAEVTGLTPGYVATMAYNLKQAKEAAASDPLAQILKGEH